MKPPNRWDLNALFNSKPHLKALNPQFDKVKESLPLEPENPLKPHYELDLGDSEGSISFIIWGQPVPKPRQTRSDKWKKRPCVMRYRAWADKARASVTKGADLRAIREISFIAYLEFPKSYSKKKRNDIFGTPHLQNPDVDNILKAILDALFKEDSTIWKVSGEKKWEDGGGPRVEIILK